MIIYVQLINTNYEGVIKGGMYTHDFPAGESNIDVILYSDLFRRFHVSLKGNCKFPQLLQERGIKNRKRNDFAAGKTSISVIL